MRTHGSAQQLEQVRREAVRLLEEGDSPPQVAQRLAVSLRSVQRWRKAAREQGPDGLAAKPHPGRQPLLSDRQQEDLIERLIAGAISQGFDTDLWTCPRVQQLIERAYGVSYHVDHIPWLLKSLGFSPQKPQRRAIERDEVGIENWIASDWPRVKKKLPGSAPTWFSLTKTAFS